MCDDFDKRIFKYNLKIYYSSKKSLIKILFIQDSFQNCMIDLFQDRRVFVNQKRKQFQRNPLPDLKYHMTLLKRNNDNFLLKNQSTQSNNIIIYNNFQPLSNILISKRICPTNNPQTQSKKYLQRNYKEISNNPFNNPKQSSNNTKQINSNIKMDSLKRIIHVENPEQNKQGLVESQLVKLVQQSVVGKRNSTSLSYRIRLKQRQKQKICVQNLSTGIQELPLKSKIKYEDNLYCFLIPKANNNEDLVREILLSRKIWKQVKPGEQVPHLKWIFSKQRYNYKKMFSYTQKKVVNHFQFNEEISTKDNLVRNLQLYCQTKKIELFNITPITFIIDFDDEYCQYNIKQFLAFFTKHDPRKNQQSGNSRKSFNQTNSFLTKFQPFMSWQNSDIKKRVNILSRPVNNPSYYSQNSYLWLLKPTGLNRGRGIEIFDSIDTLQKMLISFLEHLQRKKFTQVNSKQNEIQKKKNKGDKEKQKQKQKQLKQSLHKKQLTQSGIKQLQSSICLTSPKKSKQNNQEIYTQPITQQSPPKACRQKFKLNTCSFVIQKYIEKPFLIQGRKFDIRVWALLTHKMELFFCKQGYIRTSTQVYSTDNIGNYFIHLTNNAIQKNAENYGQFQNGNQLSFKKLNKYMEEEKVNQIWQKMKQITFMSFSSVKKKINYYQRRNCFQLFGIDFFISYDQKVWLIEVNENPCIECSSQLLGQLIPRMLNDAFKLTVDQILDKKPQQEKSYKVDGYQDNQSLWQKLGALAPNQDYSPNKKQNLKSNPQNIPLLAP